MGQHKQNEKKKAARKKERDKDHMPPPGPHAHPCLTNEDATPGAGAMSDPKKQDGDVDGGTG